jgi:low affinity Fe/Cu permease
MHRRREAPAGLFADMARRASIALGSPWAFTLACVSVLAWG